uniref:IS110 family transposase n=1 Tax=Fodinibius sp. SL11 TaxID=3425690 RepID=UPI003F881552
MEASYYIGIDISKQRLDWQVNDSQNNSHKNGQEVNTPKGIHKMITQWKRAEIDVNELIVCFEHTGPYGLLLATILEESGICYVVVSAVQVQLSLGIRRGKSDPID